MVILALGPALNAGTIVRFSTTLGDFDVLLYDEDAPLTVANFMNYVRDGDYAGSFFHRSVPGFVLQGGGFFIEGNTIFDIPTDPPVQNEPGISNLRGTLAMAKLGGDPDSATSQWFINLADNSANLDEQNGGFTVFGRVLGSGMDVVDALAAVTVYDASQQLGGTFSDLPLLAPSLAVENFLYVNSITPVSFEVNSIQKTGSSVTIQWTELLHTTVDVERCTGLDLLDWSTIETGNSTNSFTDLAAPAGSAFYRVSVPVSN